MAIPERQSEYGHGINYQYTYGNKTYDEDGKFRRTNIWGLMFEGQNVPQYNSPIDPATPDFVRGVNNKFAYKNLTLSF